MTTTTTKQCPTCGEDVEIELRAEDKRMWLEESQEPYTSPCCDAPVYVEDMDAILDAARQAHMDREAEFSWDR